MPNWLHLFVNGLYHLGLALWIGGAVALGALAAPVLFGALPRQQAGAIFGPTLRRLAKLRLGAVTLMIFDAARSFVQQVGPVTLRRWSGDPEMEAARRWFQYDPRNLQLLSGAMLQITLVVAMASTVMAFDDRPTWEACLYAVAIWIAVAAVWKFVLAFIPEDLGEKFLRALLPFSHFFYLLFWPVLFPLRRLFARLERERDADDDEEEEEVTDEEVQAFIDVGEEEGILEGTEGRMVQSVVEFGERLDRVLMTTRIDMVVFDASRTVEEMARMFSESKASRLLIYTERLGRNTGI